MKNTALYLPGFRLATLRRKPRSAAQRLADEKARIRQHSISQLGDCFSHFLPAKALENEANGAFSRRGHMGTTGHESAFSYIAEMASVDFLEAGKQGIK